MQHFNVREEYGDVQQFWLLDAITIFPENSGPL
jgi:hypothetical protein